MLMMFYYLLHHLRHQCLLSLMLLDYLAHFLDTKLTLINQKPCLLAALLICQIPYLFFPFKWSPNGFRYLGIFVTPNFYQIYKNNFTPLFDKIKQDLDLWNSFSVSWMGQISLFKMNILLRLFYPIQVIPVVFTKRVLQDLNGWLSSFIWNKSQPMLKMSVLQLPGLKGGLDLPNIRIYQLCAHLRFMSDWIAKEVSSVWLDIETNLSGYPLQDLLFFKSFKTIKEILITVLTPLF